MWQANSSARREAFDDELKKARLRQQLEYLKTAPAVEKKSEESTKDDSPAPKKVVPVIPKPSKSNTLNNQNSSRSDYNPLTGGGGIQGFRPSGEMRKRGGKR